MSSLISASSIRELACVKSGDFSARHPSNVKCTNLDTDILECDAETENDFENSCTHADDVGLRCYDVSWSGIRLGMTARKSTIKHATIEYAGLFDHALNSFKPGENLY